MNKLLSSFLLALLMGIPVLMIIGASYFNQSHSYDVVNDHFLSESENDIEILFFGFVGCASVCPSSLTMLATLLESQDKFVKSARVGATFVDINLSGTVDETQVENYSRLFSNKIRGINPDEKDLEMMRRDFSLRITSNRRTEDLITHTDHYFVLAKSTDGWSVVRILENSSNADTVRKAISEAASLII